MTRAKPAPSAVPSPAPSPDLLTASDELVPDELEQLLNEAKTEGAVVRVSQQPSNDRTGKFQAGGHLFETSWADFGSMGALLNKIRDDYGGGAYRVRVQSGRQVIINRVFPIAAPRENPAAVVQAPPAAQTGLDVPALMREMQSQMQGQMLEITKLLLANVGKGGGGGTGLELKDAIGLAQMLKGEQKDPFKQVSELTALLSTLGVKIQTGAGNAEQEINLASLLPVAVEGIKGIAELVKNAPKPAAPAAPAAAAIAAPVQPRPAPAAASPAAVAPASPADAQAVLMASLQQLVPLLIRLAQQQTNAESCADVIDALIPEAHKQVVIGFAAQPAALEQLIQMAAPLGEHREWLAEVLEDLIEPYVEEEGGGTGAAPANGAEPATQQH